MNKIIKNIGASITDIPNTKYSIITISDEQSAICKVSEKAITLYDFKKNNSMVERSDISIISFKDESNFFSEIFKVAKRFKKITNTHIKLAKEYKETSPIMISAVKKNIKDEVMNSRNRYFYEMSYDKATNNIFMTAYTEYKMNNIAFKIVFDLNSFMDAKIPFVKNINIISSKVNISTIFKGDANVSFAKSYRVLVKKNSWHLA